MVVGRIVRHLTQPEIDERRRLGLCFNCDERYVRGHNRSCKKLFLLDVDYDDADNAEDTEDLKVSLLAVTGIHQDMERTSGTVLQLLVHIGQIALCALVDSGCCSACSTAKGSHSRCGTCGPAEAVQG